MYLRKHATSLIDNCQIPIGRLEVELRVPIRRLVFSHGAGRARGLTEIVISARLGEPTGTKNIVYMGTNLIGRNKRIKTSHTDG